MLEKFNLRYFLYLHNPFRRVKYKELALQDKFSQIIINSSDPEELKNRVVKELAVSLKALRCFIVEYDSNNNIFKKITNAYNTKRDSLSLLGFDVETDMPFIAIKHKYVKHTIVNDIEVFLKENNLVGTPIEEHYKKYGVKALITLKLSYDEDFMGILVVHYANKEPFLKYDVFDFLKIISERISIALHLSNLYVSEKTIKEKERLLRSLISIMSKDFDLMQITKTTFEILAKSYNAQAVFINIDIAELKNIYSYNPDMDYVSDMDKFNAKLIEIYNLSVFDEVKNLTHYIPDVHDFIIQNNLENTEIENFLAANNVKSLILWPIFHESILYGTLIIHFNFSKNITVDDLAFINTMSEQLAIAIKQASNFEKEQKNAKRESLLRYIIETIRSTLDIATTRKAIVDIVGETLAADRCFILEYDSQNEKFLTIKEEYLSSTTMRSCIGVDLSESIPHFISEFLKGKRLILSGTNAYLGEEIIDINDEKFELEKNAIEYYNVNSALVFPLTYLDDFLGDLVIHYAEIDHKTSEDDIKLLESIANQVAIALHHSTLYNLTKEQAEKESLLRQIIESASKSIVFEDVLYGICKSVLELFKVDRVSIAKTNNVNLNIFSVVENVFRENVVLPENFTSLIELPTYWNDYMVHNPKIKPIANLEESDLPDAVKNIYLSMGVKSIICVPLKYQDVVWGGMFLFQHDRYRDWAKERIEVFEAVASQIYIAIRQSELYTQVEKNEKYTRVILDNIKDGVITIDDNFIIKSCNHAVEDIWGYSSSDIIGNNLDILLSYNRSSFKKLDSYVNNEVYGIRKNKEEFPVEIDLSEISLDYGIVSLLVIRDITERKKIDKMKNEFISTVSHELRTPLTSIKGSLGLIISGTLGALPPKIDKLVQIADNNCNRLVNLINDILDLEKITEGKYEFIFEKLGINSLISQAISLNKPYADLFSIGILPFEFDEEYYVMADKTRLLQVMSNLIANAVKFSKSHGEICIFSQVENDKVKVSIQDKGIGIPSHAKGKLFKSFSQVDSSDTRVKGGTGLGLSICKLIIENMNGRIDYESEEGVGSTFYFVLPLIKDS